MQPLWKTVWRFLKKLGIKPPYDPSIRLPGIYPEETKVDKDTCTSIFTAALFTIARTRKQSTCPLTDEWIKKLWYIYEIFSQFSSVAQLCSTPRPHELQHARPPCPSPTPGAYPNSCAGGFFMS